MTPYTPRQEFVNGMIHGFGIVFGVSCLPVLTALGAAHDNVRGVIGAGIYGFCFLLLFTWENLEVIRLGRETTRLRAVQRELEQENKRLRLDLEKMTSLGAVEKRARSLGFVETEEGQVIVARIGSETTPDPVSPPTTVQVASSSPETR